MSNFLLELLVEEIPARFQSSSAQNFFKLFVGEFQKNRIGYSDAKSYITPRRMVFAAKLADKIPVFSEDKKGPQVSAPAEVIAKFLQSIGCSRESCTEKELNGKKFIYAEIKHEEKFTKDLLGGIVKNVIFALPWPKSMRWGSHSFCFVRPLRNIICLLQDKIVCVNMEGEIGLQAVNYTFGHRFMYNKKVFANDIDSYLQKMLEAKVVVDQNERRKIILDACQNPSRLLAECSGSSDAAVSGAVPSVDITEDLLEEVVGLVEYPVVMMGKISEKFMRLPDEVIMTTMRTHQRYFPTNFGDKLAPYFVFVANNVAEDGGAAIRAGNERVLSARLSDALFFFENDITTPLERHLDDLKKITFNDKLGNVYDRVLRIRDICEDLCDSIATRSVNTNELPMLAQNSKEILKRAALLAKCDLATSMVCEFTELQGIMGAHYAHYQGEPDEVCDVIRDQYKPVDELYSPLCAIYSMADKVDAITSLFAIGKVPTGSKDPFALRRAAVGIVKIISKYEMNVDLREVIKRAFVKLRETMDPEGKMNPNTVEDVMEFILDRLRVVLKDAGIDHNVINAVTSVPQDVCSMIKKAKILDAALKSDLGNQVLAIYKRARNIVQGNLGQLIDESLFFEREEQMLFDEIKNFEASMMEIEESQLDIVERFEKKLQRCLATEKALSEFFDKVLVKAEDEAIQKNRIGMLAKLVSIFNGFLPEIGGM